MSRIVTEALAAYGFVERQFILLKRYWMWELVWILYGMSMTLSIGFLGVGMQSLTGVRLDTNHLILYLLTGSLLWGYLSGLFWDISNIVSWERWEGTIEYTFMAPISRISHIFGMSLFAIVYGIVRTLLMLGLVVLFFHLDLGKANLGGALVVLGIASFSFLGFGTMVAVLPLMSPEKGSQIAGIVEGILLMVSGVYYETSVLPRWMQAVSALSPATYTLRGMRRALVQGAGLGELADCLLPLAVMGIILIPLGLKVFQWGEMYCKRTGKLKRSG
ncbi:MAG TPA: ABC transporter permease [Armatimonadota bacterium]|nr:ABC transporter permease [Armatimonadota bacterium]